MSSSSTKTQSSRSFRWVARALLVIALLNVATYYTIVWFKSLAAPSVQSFALWSAIGVLLLVLIPRRGFRRAFPYVLAPLFALTAYEAYAALRSGEQHAAPPSNTAGYYSTDRGDVLGFGPSADFVNRSVLERDGRVLYDVKYTIDDRGLRLSPPETPPVDGTLLFFGDSFTFGEGVADVEAMPYRFGELTGGRYRVLNFGFQGYGAHQMLSAIEHGLVRDLAQPKGKVRAVYQAIPDHVRRVAGLAHYDTHGPRYVLGADGKVTFAGHFDDDGFSVFLRKLYLYQRLTDVRAQVGPRDIELFAAVVARSRELLARDLGATFHVLYWDTPRDAHTSAIAAALARRRLDVHPISRVLPGYPAREAEYTISGDGHPTAAAHRRIAEYVASEIVRTAPGAALRVTGSRP